MMTSRERLMAAIEKRPADRPGLSFYEIGGFAIDPDDPDPFNTYKSESWRHLLDLAEKETDLILMRSPKQVSRHQEYNSYFSTREYMENGSRFSETTLTAGPGGRTLTSLSRRDPGLHTTWVLKHLLSDLDDLDAYLSLPDDIFDAEYSYDQLQADDTQVGDRGIVMVDTADPLCLAASLFSMEDYTIMALTEQERFHRLLEKLSLALYKKTKQTAEAFPGHLWRIYGPEYATEPYLPPTLFREYVNRYTGPMVDMIHSTGGHARIHCHGRIASALPAIVEMGADAIDPVEPPGQGDVELKEVALHYGDTLTLFGNVEVSDIENMGKRQFEENIKRSVEAGVRAKGFVLMPTASPYGTEIPESTMRNYETMVRVVQGR